MADNNSEKAFPVSWDQFHRDCRALTWRLAEVGPFHAVVAITRGGLVQALVERFATDERQARSDVRGFLSMLCERGLVSEAQ